MAKPWYKRLYKFLAGYGEDTPAMIVVTPLVPPPALPPKPLTIVEPVGKVTDAVKRKIAKARRKRS